MSIKFSTIPQKRLLAGITSLSSSFYLNNILSFDGLNNVAASDLGTQHYVCFRNDTGDVIELMEIDPATISAGPVTILRRGLSFYGDRTTETTALKLDWPANSIVMLGTDVPQIFQYLKEYIDAAAIAGSVPASTSAAGIVVEASQAEVNAGTPTKSILGVPYKLFAPLDKLLALFASTTQQGLVEEATVAEIAAATAIGATGARLYINPSSTVSTSAGAADAGKIPRLNSSGFIDQTLIDQFPQQVIELLSSATVQTAINMTSDPTGATLFIFIQASTTVTIFRLTKDAKTLTYQITHTTTLTASSMSGAAVLGSYVYLACTIAAANTMRRYLAADLTGVTTMTISGTNDIGHGNQMFADGTQLYIYSAADTFRIYTVSGTTATAGSTLGFTSAGTQLDGSISNGTNVWILAQSTGTLVIRKYAIAGGAVVSTTTLTIPNLYPNETLNELFLVSPGLLGIGKTYTIESNTAVKGTVAGLRAITLP